MFAAIRPGLTEPEGHFRSFFAVSTQKYGLARQSLYKKSPPVRMTGLFTQGLIRTFWAIGVWRSFWGFIRELRQNP